MRRTCIRGLCVGMLFAACAGLFALRTASLRADDVTDIVITEVMYNPASGDRNEDFVELFNLGTQAYDLEGFHFTSGLVFTFPQVVLGAGEYLVVCADEDTIRRNYGITNTVGNWDPETNLANSGERIKLVNASGVEVEDLVYDDRYPWPVLADGYGHSLERRSPYHDNDDPANWSASQSASWTKVSVTGLATSETVYLYLSAAGTAYVDDFRIYPTANPGDNRVTNGGFESAALTPWTPAGNHSGSVATTERARSGSRSLKLVATGAGTGSQNGVRQADLGLIDDDAYTLEFWVWFPEPGQTVIARLSGTGGAAEPIQVEAGGGGATPGLQNSVYATDIPPFIFPATHSPATPVASSQVALLAAVKDDLGVSSVTAHWDAGAGERTAPMFDDGAHDDLVAGDGVFGVRVGTFATGTVVRYWFTATDTLGQGGRYPFEGNPTPTRGFYIQPTGINPGFQARSNTGLVSALPPVYHLLIDPGYLDGDSELLNPTTYVPATFIFNGEVFDNIRVRHRGQSSLNRPKRHWKVDFNKDHRFRTPFEGHDEVDNINIQSCEGDKSFLREWLLYKAMMDAGRPGLEAWHVRMYVNGAYRGLYMNLENPDEDWMDRVDLDNEGWLWKSYSEAKGGTGGIDMEEDAGRPADATAALGSFISSMNSLTGQALVNYINANMDVGTFIDFLAVHQLGHDADHPAKNYLIYADEDAPAGSWTYLLWDADLSHGRNFECTGCAGGLGSGVWNDCIRWDFWSDPQLLFGTSVRPKCDGPWNGVINGFLNRTTAFRPLYYARVASLLDELYHPDVIKPIIDDMAAPLAPEVALDWARNPPTYGIRNSATQADYLYHVSELKRFIDNRYDYLASALELLTVPDIRNLVCQRVGSAVALSWTNGGAYQSIRVYRNDTLVNTLPGTATQVDQALDMAQTVNRIRVASVVDGVTRTGQSCSIIITSGGYTKVIDEDFATAVPAGELDINCDAVQSGGALQLTPPEGDRVGNAFFLPAFPTDDFIADFDFRLDEPSDPGADGLTFIINTGADTSSCGGAGGGMGYFSGDGGTPVFPGYAVILDTWENPGEPSHNWAGFVDADESPWIVEAVAVPEEFTGSGTFHARVIGQGGDFRLLLSNTSIGMAEREVFRYVDPDYSPGDAHFGFSAGTGSAFARHLVDNFVLQVQTGAAEVTAGFTADRTSGTMPLQVQFTNTSVNADSYLWQFGDGETSTSINPRHTYPDAGTYTVTLNATGAGGSDVETKANYISVAAPLAADFSATPRLGRAPLAVTFTNTSTGATSYSWDFGDGGSSTLASPSHTYATAGLFTVTLTARGPNDGQDSMTLTNYIQVDGPIQADFQATPTSGTAPLSVQFADRSVGTTITSWQWSFGDGAVSTERNPAHVYSANGSYAVSLTVYGYSLSDAETKAAYIRVGPLEETFVRGDANWDSTVDISDSIFVLNFLFLGGEDLTCPDAGDSDDDGEVNITDAIRILAFLFQGGVPPAPPYPAAGADATPDSLGACRRP